MGRLEIYRVEPRKTSVLIYMLAYIFGQICTVP